MNQHFGYLVDLSKVQLDENGNVSWIQAFPYGKWNHPVYGEIEMDAVRAEKMAANVKANVRGQDLNIDYDHKPGEAAGWVKNAEARSDGLWLAVEWTKEAAEKIKNRVYRYFSPEYADEWDDPRTKSKHTDVLFGGGITNRPFLKGILPLNLSEAFATQTHSEETGESVDPKLLRAALKLAEDASDDDVAAALKKLTEPAPKPETLPTDEQKKLDDQKLADKAKLLAETDPVVRALNDRIALLEGATRLSEVELALKSLDEPGDKVTIAPAVIEQAKAIALNAPRATGDAILKLLKEVKKNGIVKLTEEGRTPPEGNGDKTATQELSEKAAKYAKDNEVQLADAMSVIAGLEPALWEQYRNESYLRERGQ